MEEDRREGDLSCELYPHHDHSSHLRIGNISARCTVEASASTLTFTEASVPLLGGQLSQAPLDAANA